MLETGRADRSAGARTFTATWVSAGLHVVLALAVLYLVRDKPRGAVQPTERHKPTSIVWLDRPGDIGGGGNRGNNSSRPPQQAQRRGNDRRSLPARQPVTVERTTTEPPPVQEISVPALPEASGVHDIAGAVSTVAVADPSSLGLRPGRGSGDGAGSGLDRGFGMNSGGGPSGPGSAITSPAIIRQVRPNYTNAALQARVRGLVVMDAVVLPDGSVGEVKIVRSLDQRFGLDEEAIKAVKQWRFRPARRAGGPISMLVSVEMMFELR
jgi:protein TonB